MCGNGIGIGWLSSSRGWVLVKKKIERQRREAAKSSFLAGANWAYAAGCIAIAVGALIVGIWFPRRQAEIDLVASYEAEDAHAA